jgi:hypothetical protein
LRANRVEGTQWDGVFRNSKLIQLLSTELIPKGGINRAHKRFKKQHWRRHFEETRNTASFARGRKTGTLTHFVLEGVRESWWVSTFDIMQQALAKRISLSTIAKGITLSWLSFSATFVFISTV